MTQTGRIQRAVAVGQLASKRLRVRRYWAIELVLSNPAIRRYDASVKADKLRAARAARMGRSPSSQAAEKGEVRAPALSGA